MVRQVPPERVFTGIIQLRPAGHAKATLTNEVGHILWRCDHLHVPPDVSKFTAAQDCADAERKRWIRTGKGRA